MSTVHSNVWSGYGFILELVVDNWNQALKILKTLSQDHSKNLSIYPNTQVFRRFFQFPAGVIARWSRQAECRAEGGTGEHAPFQIGQPIV